MQRALVGLQRLRHVEPQASRVEHGLERIVELAGDGLAAVRLAVADNALAHAQRAHGTHDASLAKQHFACGDRLAAGRDLHVHDWRRPTLNRLGLEADHPRRRIHAHDAVPASVVQVQRPGVALPLQVGRLDRPNPRARCLQRVRVARGPAQRHVGVDAPAQGAPWRSCRQLARVGEAFHEPARVIREQAEVVALEWPLRRGTYQVAQQNRGVAGIDRRLLHGRAEERVRMLNVVLVQRVVAGNEHDHGFAVGAAAHAAGLLPEAHAAARVAGDDRHVQRADVDAQLERVR